jgi:NADH-quinone oxidoreductase E subunit
VVSSYLSEKQRKRLDEMASRYPQRRSLVIPALWEVQKAHGCLTEEAMEEVAEFIRVTPAQVREIATFYAMFREKPSGRYIIMVCGTLSCAVCGAEGLLTYLEEKLGIRPGETTEDGLFSLEEVECLGACSWAPVMLINDNLYIRLTREKVDSILEQCRNDADK